jgi:hypothetical protein
MTMKITQTVMTRRGRSTLKSILRAERVEIELRSAPGFLLLGGDDQRRQHEDDAQKEEEDAGAGEEAELGHASEICGQKCVEGRRCGDGCDADARNGLAHDHPDGRRQILTPIALVDITPVGHGDEVDAQAGQQCGEGRADLG